MIFHQLQFGPMENFSYLIGDEKTKEVAIFDPGWEGEKYLDLLEKKSYTLKYIFLTHVHYDHSGQAQFLSDKTGATIVMSERLKEEKRGHAKFILPKKHQALKHNETTSFGNILVKSLEAPGHQDDHLIFIVGSTLSSNQYLITGDVLFVGSIGGLHFEYSMPEKMPQTLEMINTLSDTLMLCPGHDYGHVKMQTLGQEKKENPYLLDPLLALQN